MATARCDDPARSRRHDVDEVANGFSDFWSSLGVFVCYAGALAGIVLVLKEMQLSVASAIWPGAGTALTTAVGIAWFGEPAGLVKTLSMALVLLGVVGLHTSA